MAKPGEFSTWRPLRNFWRWVVFVDRAEGRFLFSAFVALHPHGRRVPCFAVDGAELLLCARQGPSVAESPGGLLPSDHMYISLHTDLHRSFCIVDRRFRTVSNKLKNPMPHPSLRSLGRRTSHIPRSCKQNRTFPHIKHLRSQDEARIPENDFCSSFHDARSVRVW